ncbi:MAG: uroporphyrinogen decarboxylase family protein [Armatimonadota bacterium]
MTKRERFLQTMTFGTPDRPSQGEYFYYPATRERWEREGLPAGVDLNDFFEIDFDPFRWTVPASYEVLPPFDEAVLEETEEYIISRIASGDVHKVLKNTPPPAMPQFISHPLRSREDWPGFQRRLDPNAPGRFPADFARWAAERAERDYPLGVWLGGSYGYLRNWWGVEGISLLLYDDPSLVEEMIEQLIHLSSGILDHILATGLQLDWVMFWEDLGFKTAPLISPDQFERFCMPFYRAMMDKVRQAGIPVVMLDSDGNIWDMIPLWLDAGITVMHPMEVASGMDVIEARRRYGKQVGFFGGIDKRALAGSFEDIRAEVLPKMNACLEDGGFIAACDHAVPPDVSFDNFRYYRDLIRETGEKYLG